MRLRERRAVGRPRACLTELLDLMDRCRLQVAALLTHSPQLPCDRRWQRCELVVAIAIAIVIAIAIAIAIVIAIVIVIAIAMSFRAICWGTGAAVVVQCPLGIVTCF